MTTENDKPQEMKFRPNRTFICSVVFIDIVAYSMKPVDDQMRLKEQFTAILANSIRDVAVSDRIVLDTGDGAAVSFLSDPEEALIAAMGIQGTIRSLPRDASPLLEVRIGINLGPVKLIKDINDNPNLVGDGINVAQRIMSFAGPGELLVSRSYFDVVSRLSEDYSRLFQYRGARADKHVREHDIYQVTPPAAKPAPAPEPVIIGQPPPPQPIAIEPEKENKQDAGEEKEIEREKQTTEAEPAKPAARPQAGPGLLRNRKRMFGIGGALLAVIVIVVLLIVPGVRKASQTGKTADAPKTSKEQPAQPASALLSGKKRAEAEEERLEFRAQSLKADEIVFTLSGARLSGKQVTLVVHARNQSRAAKSIALYDSAYRWTKSSITDQAGRSSVVSSVYSMSGGKKTTMYQAGTAGLPVAAGSSTSIYMTFPAPSRSVRSLRSFHLHPFIYQGRNWREHSLTFRSVGIES